MRSRRTCRTFSVTVPISSSLTRHPLCQYRDPAVRDRDSGRIMVLHHDAGAAMTDLPDALREGLDAALARVPAARLAGSVQRLMTAYRSGAAQTAPVLASETDVAAYAA